MQKRLKSWPSLLAMLLAGLLVVALACGVKSYVVVPELGPPLEDVKRDLEGSQKRLEQFEDVCVRPLRRNPPALPPSALCAWIMQADQVIRANNWKARQ